MCRWNYNGSYPYGYQPLGPASKTAEPFWMASDQFSIAFLVRGLTNSRHLRVLIPVQGVPGGGQGPGCPFQGAINHNLVFRNNRFLSNAGLLIAGNTLNGLVEG
jgi:hypothetical protein